MVSGDNFHVSGFPDIRIQAGEISSVCLFFPEITCSLPDSKIPIKSKASKGQLQNMDKV